MTSSQKIVWDLLSEKGGMNIDEIRKSLSQLEGFKVKNTVNHMCVKGMLLRRDSIISVPPKNPAFLLAQAWSVNV